MSKKCKKLHSSPNRGRKDQMSGENKKMFDFSEKDWQESKCPICLEHPHNSVLLICSSHGCRPVMCDTSDLLSNCFTQFCRLHSVIPSDSGKYVGSGEAGRKRQLGCPLCRGVITGWVVLEPARRSMNELVRNCSVDCCEFSGNYSDLRNHAESEHPETRPREDVGEVAQDEELDGIVGDDLLQYVDFDDALFDPNLEELELVDNLLQYVDDDHLHPVDLDGALSDPIWEEVEFDSVDDLVRYVDGPLDYLDWEELNEGIILESLLDAVQFD